LFLHVSRDASGRQEIPHLTSKVVAMWSPIFLATKPEEEIVAKVVDLEKARKKKEGAEEAEPTKAKLSKRVVDAAEWDPNGGKWQVVWDTELSGYGLRLRWNEKRKFTSKTYILTYRSEGKRRQLTIGPTTKLTPTQARDAAEKFHAQIVMGSDPSKEKQDARHAPAELTFLEIFERFIEDYAKPRRKSWKTDEYRLLPKDDDDRVRTDAPIARLHGLKPTELKREELEHEIAHVHARLSSRTPVEANRVVQTVGRVVNWGAKFGFVPREFYNILEFVDLNKESPRTAYMRPSELPAFAAALNEESLHWRAAFWLTLLTGARMKSETLKLRWDDVHPGVGEFTFRGTKNGTDHTLPMTPAIRAIFDALPKDSEWVFPSRRANTHLTDPKKALGRIKKRAKFVDNVTAHSLRDTASTYMRSKLHLPDGLNRAVLNHSSVGITDRYAHAGIDDVRVALEKLDAFILEQAGIEDLSEYLKTGSSGEASWTEITREELHELVWSMPMREAAAKLGMSDVGLKKVCKRMDVETPPRGHWLRVRRGEGGEVPALKSSRAGTVGVYRIRRSNGAGE